MKATKVSKKDQKALKQGGEFFLDKISEMMTRLEIQRAADNLGNLLSWAEEAQALGKVLKKEMHPIQIIALGIVVGKRGGKFPFTSSKEISDYQAVRQ
jgi:hypothetical protein